MKQISVTLSLEAKEVYLKLKEKAVSSKAERILFNSINQKISFILENSHYGNPIAKKLIPEEYKIKYEITNLFRVELPCFWRMLYTLKDGENEIEIISFILGIMDHKDYNKKFGYD